MRTRLGAAAVYLGLVASAALAVGPAHVAAASPSLEPSPAPTERPLERPPFEVWLDRPIPTDARPGDRLDVGATIWDRLAGEIPRMGATIFLRALPAEGAGNAAGPPAQTFARTDWPGHFRGTVEVPPGGLGGIELGVSGTVCENDVCGPADWVFDMGGVGPPPDAPISDLAEARISLGADPVDGTPTELSAVLTPQADWESLPAPDAIVVRAREPRGPTVASASLALTDAAGLVYTGSITIPRAGDLVLEAATDEDGGDATRFGTSMVPVTVGQGSDGGAPTEPAGPGEIPDDGPPPVVIALLALVAILGIGAILSGFRGSER